MKKWIVILVFELVLLLFGVAGLFRPSAKIYEATQDNLEQVQAGADRIFLTEATALKVGVYKAVLNYEVKEAGFHSFGVRAEEELPFRGLRTNEIALSPQKNSVECEFYLTAECRQLQAYIYEEEGGMIAIKSIQLYSTNAGSRILIFWIILLSALVNGAVRLYEKNQKEPLPIERQLTITCAVVTGMMASLPLFVDYIIMDSGAVENLHAISRVANNLQEVWAEGNLFLIVPALLRRIGLSVNMTYRISLWILNIATVAVAYKSILRATKNYEMTMAGMAFWTLNPYRLFLLYEKGDLKVVAWMMLAPVVITFVWCMVRRSVGKRREALQKHQSPMKGLTKNRLRVICAVVIVVTMLGATYQTNRILIEGQPMWVYNLE